ncbi:MAG: homoserine kinase, partial [Propionibacteriaceae bacterium]
EDFLHQEFRASAMPESFALVQQLRAQGRAAFISGAGPTVLVLGTAADLDGTAAQCPQGWATHALAVDPAGVRVVAS